MFPSSFDYVAARSVEEALAAKREGGDDVRFLAGGQSLIPMMKTRLATPAKLVDINVLYVGSDYSITHIVAERLVQGATLEEGLLAFTDTSFGMERMIAVLTEAPPESEMEDLSFLAQGGETDLAVEGEVGAGNVKGSRTVAVEQCCAICLVEHRKKDGCPRRNGAVAVDR